MKRLKNKVGIWIILKSQWSLVLTQLTKKVNQENVVKKANTYPISANNNIDTVNKTDKSQTSKETVHTSKK